MIENTNLPQLKPRFNSVSSLLNSESVSPEKLSIEIKRLRPRILDLKEQTEELMKKIPPDLLSSFNEIQQQMEKMSNGSGFDNEKDFISLKLFNVKGKFLSKINSMKQDISLHTEMRLQNIIDSNISQSPFVKGEENYKFEKMIENIERQMKVIENRSSKKLTDIELLLSQKRSFKSETTNTNSNKIGKYIHSMHKMKSTIYTYNAKLEFLEREWKEVQPVFNIFNFDNNSNDQESIFDIVKNIPQLDEKLEESKQTIKKGIRRYTEEINRTEEIIGETEKNIEEKENEILEMRNRLNELNEYTIGLQKRATELMNIIEKSSKKYTPEDQKQDIEHMYMLYSGNQELMLDNLKFIEDNLDSDYTSYIKYRI